MKKDFTISDRFWKKLKRLFLIIIFTSFFSNFSFAQVGINTQNPQVTFDVTKGVITNIPDGVLVPRLTIEDLEENLGLYSTEQHSTLIYITSNLPGSTDSTKEISRSGYYFYNHDSTSENGEWRPLGGLNTSEPIAIWVRDVDNKTVKLSLISSGENRTSTNALTITDDGNLAVGKEKANENSILDIQSFNKGVSLPSLTSAQRETITGEIPNGLMIYNLDENCFNYYDQSQENWRSLCGTYPPASFNLIDCDSQNAGPVGGNLIAGNSLNPLINIYVIRINVTKPGTFEISAQTNNGYGYYKTGTYTQIGTYDVILNGQGTPLNANLAGDQINLVFNGIALQESACRSVIVDNSTTTYSINCDNITKGPGIYLKGQGVTSDHYVDVSVNVLTAGNATITTPNVNGISFSSGPIELSTGTQTIRLYASGTPTIISNNVVFEIPGTTGENCPFTLEFKTNLGTFENPAISCDALFNEGVRDDGNYWIGSSSSNKYLTKCDMVDEAEATLFKKETGGYTLLWSTSEKTTNDNNWWSNGGYMSLRNGWGRNIVTQQNGTLNVNDFRISDNEKGRWNGKATRLVVTTDPNDPNNVGMNNILNINFVPSNLITGGNLVTGYYGTEVGKGYYIGADLVITKNQSGDRHTINIAGEDVIANAYLYSNSDYPFHWDLTTYGYYPQAMLPGAVTQNNVILDGNWPFWVAGEAEGSGGDEPFGYCNTTHTTTQNKFWGNKNTSPSVSNIPACNYSNTATTITPNVNNGEGKVMQWWAK